MCTGPGRTVSECYVFTGPGRTVSECDMCRGEGMGHNGALWGIMGRFQKGYFKIHSGISHSAP